MEVFFDTSAVVPLVLSEPETAVASAVWEASTHFWAWKWMPVEAEAALTRRKADAVSWRAWRLLFQEFRLVELGADHLLALRSFNRALGLRAADVGHLFLFDRLLGAVAEVSLLTFDAEMASAARQLGLPLHPASAG